MRAFRLLTASEIECRISEISRTGKGLSLLLYKTARTDAALLDETYTPERWQNDFKTIDGRLYGGIGIKFGDEWLWRWDCGTESNMEAEKGQASDAFKRAGFKWGLGAELYTAPRIFVFSDKCDIRESNGKYKCYDTFAVDRIGYDESGNINELTIINTTTGNMCYQLKDGLRAPTKPQEPQNNSQDKTHGDGAFTPVCADCGAEIAVNVHDFSVKKYNKPLCRDCQKKMR